MDLDHQHSEYEPIHKEYQGLLFVESCGPGWRIIQGRRSNYTYKEIERIKNEPEWHELIYVSENLAVTFYEQCYAVFYLDDGMVFGGSLWLPGEWKLTESSIKFAKEVFDKKHAGSRNIEKFMKELETSRPEAFEEHELNVLFTSEDSDAFDAISCEINQHQDRYSGCHECFPPATFKEQHFFRKLSHTWFKLASLRIKNNELESVLARISYYNIA